MKRFTLPLGIVAVCAALAFAGPASAAGCPVPADSTAGFQSTNVDGLAGSTACAAKPAMATTTAAKVATPTYTNQNAAGAQLILKKPLPKKLMDQLKPYLAS